MEAHHPLLTAEYIGYKNGNTDIYKITLKNHKGNVIGDVITTCYVQLYEHEHICMSCSLTEDPSDKDRYEFLTLTEKDCLFTEDDLPFDFNILNMLKGLRKVLYILIFENDINDVYNDRFKCRAKEPDCNGWIYGYYVHNEYTGENIIIVDDEPYEIDRNTLCQNACVRAYTSYKNRTPETKSQRIYEGDIVKVFSGNRLYCVALIVYNYFENEFVCKPIFNGYEMSLSEYNDYEVIGNKFDNPEMLDEKYYINNPDEFDLNKEY
jgi:hypothetical protein